MDRLKILVPTRGSMPALRACQAAVRLLPGGDADIRLLYVMAPELYPYPYDSEGELKAGIPKYAQGLTEMAERSLAEPRRIFEEAGCKVDLNHRFGAAAAEILGEIADWRPDLVVMGRWWAHAPERWVHGSVFERVMRHAKIPVLVVSYSPDEDDDSVGGEKEAQIPGP